MACGGARSWTGRGLGSGVRTRGAMSAQITSSPGLPAREGARKPTEAPASHPVDSHAVTKRLQSELMGLMASADAGVSAFPDGDSLFSWVGTIHGAAGTVYEGLSYKLSLRFPTGAPLAARASRAASGRGTPRNHACLRVSAGSECRIFLHRAGVLVRQGTAHPKVYKCN